VVREAAIAGICLQTHTIEELAELMGVDPTTVARWWRIFRNKAGSLMMALTRMLADSSQLSDWASGRIRTDYDQGKKIMELIGRCRATYSPGFAFSGFAWVNLLDPYLLF
jgi:transposase